MRKTIFTCDKCGKEKKTEDLYLVRFGVGLYDATVCFAETKKDYCKDCLDELVPGTFSKAPQPKILLDETRKTVGEQFEEIIREICREEMEAD
jgi:hypothetical protein